MRSILRIATSTAEPPALVAITRPFMSSRRFTGPSVEHHVFLRVVVLHAVLEFIGDHPQVGEAGVVNRGWQCREGEVRDFKLVVGERRDLLRRSGVADRLEGCSSAPCAGRVLFSP